MKNLIYYFSGTGNSLYVAKRLAEKLSCDLVSMTSVVNGKIGIDVTDCCVGLVYPTYMYRPPYIVVDFFKKLNNAGYLFIVATNGGDPGHVLVKSRCELKKAGARLEAAFNIGMPDNYTPFGGPQSDEEQQSIFATAEAKIDEIADAVLSRRTLEDVRGNWFKTTFFPGMWYALGYKFISQSDKGFWTNENCVGCNSCEKVCPVNNIVMVQKRPTWQNNCQQCFACLQWCKKEAIEMNKKTVGVQRYHHPQIKRREIIEQKGD